MEIEEKENAAAVNIDENNYLTLGDLQKPESQTCEHSQVASLSPPRNQQRSQHNTHSPAERR